MYQTISSAFGEHLASHHWDYMVTLTPSRAIHQEQQFRHFERVFIRRLSKSTQRPISWFYAAERGLSGRIHAHALLWADGKIRVECVQPAWRIGLVDVKRFRPEQMGAFYVSKSIDSSDADYQVSKQMPPRIITLAKHHSAAFEM